MPQPFYASDARHATPTLPPSSSSISNNSSVRRGTIFSPSTSLSIFFSLCNTPFLCIVNLDSKLAFRRACVQDLIAAQGRPLSLPNHGAIISESISLERLSVSRAIVEAVDDRSFVASRVYSAQSRLIGWYVLRLRFCTPVTRVKREQES